jgi:hypothetical protein
MAKSKCCGCCADGMMMVWASAYKLQVQVVMPWDVGEPSIPSGDTAKGS